MRQRVVIAGALACRPKLLIADEPTTALDVTMQAQVLELLATLTREQGTALLLITHDLGVVSDVADDVVVLYAGEVLETGPVGDVLDRPAHPYTRGLLASLPTRVTAGRPRWPSPGRSPVSTPCRRVASSIPAARSPSTSAAASIRRWPAFPAQPG